MSSITYSTLLCVKQPLTIEPIYHDVFLELFRTLNQNIISGGRRHIFAVAEALLCELSVVHKLKQTSTMQSTYSLKHLNSLDFGDVNDTTHISQY